MSTFPLSANISELTFSSNNKTLITRSLNGNEQRAQVEAQRFEASATFRNLSETARKALQSFIATQNGALNSFILPLPGDIGNSGGTNGSLTIGTHSTGDTTVTIGGSPIDIKNGDLFRISGQNKLYMFTADSSDGVDVPIFPALQDDTTAGTTVVIDGVTMNARFSGDLYQYRTDPTFFSTFTIDFIEVL